MASERCKQVFISIFFIAVGFCLLVGKAVQGFFLISCKYRFLLFHFFTSAVSDNRIIPLVSFFHSALVDITLQETKIGLYVLLLTAFLAAVGFQSLGKGISTNSVSLYELN